MIEIDNGIIIWFLGIDWTNPGVKLASNQLDACRRIAQVMKELPNHDPKLMVASNCFANTKWSVDRLLMITQEQRDPDLYDGSYIDADGIGKGLNSTYQLAMPIYKEWVTKMRAKFPLIGKTEDNKPAQTSTLTSGSANHPLNGAIVVLTHGKPPKMVEHITSHGGTVAPRTTKKATLVVNITPGDKSKNAELAEKYKIPLLTPEEFWEQYK
jgi:hypothetical protein